MRDDFLSGDWAANRHHFTADIDKLARRIARAVGDTFAALTRQQFDAPWQHRWRQVRIGGRADPPSSPRKRIQLPAPDRGYGCRRVRFSDDAAMIRLAFVAALASCTRHAERSTFTPMTWADLTSRPRPAPQATIAYGADDYQKVDVWLPGGPGPFPVVLMVHGGCWTTSIADRSLMDWAADDLRKAGYAVWNIDYRGVDRPGGGYPGTFQDVAAAADLLRANAAKYQLDLGHVVAVGHSAGGHLALWLAGAAETSRIQPACAPPTRCRSRMSSASAGCPISRRPPPAPTMAAVPMSSRNWSAAGPRPTSTPTRRSRGCFRSASRKTWSTGAKTRSSPTDSLPITSPNRRARRRFTPSRIPAMSN